LSSQTIHLKISGELADAARVLAAGEGWSWPELLRIALAEKLVRHAQVTQDNAVFLAAHGNPEALRAVAAHSLTVARDEGLAGNSDNSREALGVGLMLSKIAAVHGQSVDQTQLACAMMLRSAIARELQDMELAEGLDGDALAYLDMAAVNGSEIAASALLGAADGMSPASLDRARQTRAQLEHEA
jgi:hypothetical protein